MSADQTAVVRRFNRSYTQRIGALDESYLGFGLPLGPLRVLFEVGSEPSTTRGLRDRLGLDSGYLSRLVRRLQDDDLVELAPDPNDRRQRLATLTDKGRALWDDIEIRSDARARSLLEPLTDRQRERLTVALAEADLLVRAATITLETVDPSSDLAQRAAQAYFRELDERFQGGFDAVEQAAKDAEILSPPGGAFIVATSDGEPVACGGVQSIDDGVGEIKRMWVHPDWRGAGLGGRLLRHLESVSVGLGHGFVRLDTNDTLTDAIAMYRRAGYQEIERYNDNPYARLFFEKPL